MVAKSKKECYPDNKGSIAKYQGPSIPRSVIALWCQISEEFLTRDRGLLEFAFSMCAGAAISGQLCSVLRDGVILSKSPIRIEVEISYFF